MATYYMRADGTAANKGDAGGPGSDQAACMNVSVHNGETFTDNDVIRLADDGGVYRATLTIPSSGSSGNPITYEPESGDTPVINGADVITGWTEDFTDTSIYSKSLTSETNSSRYNHRTVIPNAEISADATLIRIQLKGHSTNIKRVDGCSIGPRSGSTDDFASAPTRITFDGGSNSTTVAAGGTKWSDWMAYTLTSSTDQLIHFWQNSADSNDKGYAFVGSGTTYRHTTLTSDETLTQTWTSDDTWGNYAFVAAIEEREGNTNVWKATVTTQPYHVFFDATKGVVKASAAALAAEFDWFWGSSLLYAYSTTDPDSAYTAIEAGARRWCISLTSKDWNIIDGIETKYAGGGGSNDADNIRVSGADNNILRNLTTSWGYQDGIAILSTSLSNLVQNVITHDNGDVLNEGNGVIIDEGCDDCTVSGSTAYNNQGDGFVSHGPDAGPPVDGILFTSLVAYNNGEQGLEFRVTSNSTMEFCESYDNAQVQSVPHGIANNGGTPRNTGNIIRYNYIHGTPGNGASSALNNFSTVGGSVYYNIVDGESSGGNGIRVSENTTTPFNVYNNTIYNSGTNGIEVFLDSDNGAVNIKNNIVHSSGSSGLRVFGANGTSVTVTDYNCVYNSTTNYVNWGGTSYNLADYITNTTNGDNSIDTDPLLVNPATADFHIQSGSPCRDKGTPLGFTQDFWGNPVPK